MKPHSVLRALGLGLCIVAGTAVAFAAGIKAGSLLGTTTTRSVSIAPTAPPSQAIAHNR